MDQLVKQVNFQDILMTACKTNDNKIFVSIKNICEGLGIDTNGQTQRINRDDVLPEGMCKIHVPTLSGEQEINMLNIEYLPFFLVGIKSSMCREEVQPKLKDFKLKAKDVLAEAFTNKPNCIEDVLIKSLEEMKQTRLIAEQASRSAAESKKQIENVKEIVKVKPTELWREKSNALVARICMKSNDYKGTKDKIYEELDRRAGTNINTRLENMRKRLKADGATETKIKKLNYLDVIAQDKKLVEIYIAVIKELAISNGIEAEKVS